MLKSSQGILFCFAVREVKFCIFVLTPVVANFTKQIKLLISYKTMDEVENCIRQFSSLRRSSIIIKPVFVYRY